MKKILPYILIFVIIANFLAPFSVGSGLNNKLSLNKNTAEAIIIPDDNGIFLSATISGVTDSAARVDVKVSWTVRGGLTSEGVRVGLIDTSGVEQTKYEELKLSKNGEDDNVGNAVYIGTAIFNDLKPSTSYTLNTEARQINRYIWTTFQMGELWEDTYSTPVDGKTFITIADHSITTNVKGVQTPQPAVTKEARNDNSILANYSCDPLKSGTWTGCFGRIIYTLIFQPTSWVFALTGKFLDWAFFYSVNDGAYRSTFVVEGWAIVRDVCNMFFIFILLYIAIGTILNLHSVKTKEMIINVVIIGLFINFSLFATQVIIDASNVLARVFYNTEIISVGAVGEKKDSTGAIISSLGKNGEIRMSEALVNKINPQELIIDSQKASEDGKPLSPGGFLIIAILASAVNIVGIIVFLSVGLIFISRVIGLWLAMIFAPLAFFTYTVPGLKGTKMIGWEKWWPETIKLAFLAPVFMFFMYIILKFLGVGLSLFNADKETGLGFVMAIMVPFIFIMILLMKAKDIASDMSGEMGQKITGGIAAGGAMLLGGAALGGAFLGRKAIGQTLATASSTRYNTEKVKYNKKLDEWNKTDPRKRTGPAPTWSDHVANANVGVTDPKLKLKEKGNLWDRVGEKYNTNQKHVGEIEHARHITDEAIAKADPSLKGQSWGNLSGTQKVMVMASVKRDEASKYMDASEREYRKTNGLEKPAPITAQDEADIVKKKEREMLATKPPGQTLLTPAETAEAKKQAAAEITEERKRREKLPDLSSVDKANIKNNAESEAENKFNTEIKHASQSIGILSQAFAKANTGTWDVRNISQSKSDKRDGFFNKIPTALIAGVALGVRAGLKNSGVNHGTGEGHLGKDLATTITEALKSIEIEVPKAPSGGGHGGGDSHGASGGGHH